MSASVAIALRTEPMKRYSQALKSIRTIIQTIAPGSARRTNKRLFRGSRKTARRDRSFRDAADPIVVPYLCKTMESSARVGQWRQYRRATSAKANRVGALYRGIWSQRSYCLPPGAHVAFLERPQEDATINRMEDTRQIVYRGSIV
jgi:hypothetical protein